MSEKPVVLMPEDIQRVMGKDAQRNNILAARMVSEVVKTTLGPKGMDKMLVSPTGDIIVTNDGVTILEEIQIEHPAAKMMVEIARTQESEVGDGTTSSVMIAGKLLENAEKLLDSKIHPTLITKGYRMAAEKAQQILNEISLKISPDDDDVLKQVAMTAMTGKGAEDSREKFADIIIRAVKQIGDFHSSESTQSFERKQVQKNWKVDLDDIKIEKAKGDSVEKTELISGIVLDKEKVSNEMPEKIEGAKIALIDFPLEIKNPEIETKISISSPEQLQNFLSQEEKVIKDMVEKVAESGANVIFCQKGIDDFAQYLLSRKKIYACRRVAKSDLEKISKATGAKIVSNLGELKDVDLGKSEVVEEIKQGEDNMTYIRGCSNPKAVTILIRGGSEHVIDEIERAIKDGLGDVASSLKTGLVVPGGGAIEIELSKRLKHFGQSLGGREQLAVEEFASALEFIPLTLAENAGMDPIDVLTELKSKHNAGDMNAGLNLFENKVDNVLNAKIIEPYKIKSQAIASATEVAIMILRIDDVIASADSKSGKMNYAGSKGYQGMD
ncbi:thermosome subunit [archaeon]|jgi:archaeal chaperonin|nr:thermosome subunit [archaeon]MBT4373510.1 thermosome subunit [archaeon]MBT4531958.1 thermosome subunit [archaeon]MBT7001625.1 thermosome subunit [archaeon]MBT7282483.1 thermosome subunit [archaeon]